MIELKELLRKGNLKTDGLSDDVVKIVLNNPKYFAELFDNLLDSNDVIRFHASDALEKLLRLNRSLLDPFFIEFLQITRNEQISFTKMHYAMIFAYYYDHSEFIDEIITILSTYLLDDNAFVVSWAISSLTIIAVKNHYKRNIIIKILDKIVTHKSKAVQNRLQKALFALKHQGNIPKSWIKN